MIVVRVTCTNQNHWITGINSTFPEAEAYFMGQTFTREDDTGREIHDTVCLVELVADEH